jgi:hypothetical protein
VSYTDIYFPLLLLNWGQGLNFIWSWQLEFFLSTALAGALLLIIVRIRAQFSKATAAAIGLCLILLTMCGAHGVALLPALALWLGFSGMLLWRSIDLGAKQDSLFIFGVCFLALLLVGLYFAGYQRVPYHPVRLNILGILQTVIQLFTMGFGPAVKSVWPFSGIGAFLLFLYSLAVLILVALRRPDERVRAAGLLMFLGAMTSLTLGLAFGRDGFEPRYITLSVPIWCCVYFTAEIYGPTKASRALQLFLFSTVCVALGPNTRFGIDYAKNLRSQLGSFEREMVAGVPGYRLINRYGEYLHPHHDIPNSYMPMLRQSGVGGFRFLRDDPIFREIALPLAPTELNQVRWEDRVAHSTGNRPHLIFSLPEERYVSGIRIKYSYSNTDGTCPYIAVYWKRNDQGEFTKDRFRKYSPTGDRMNWCHGTWTQIDDPETTMIVWLGDTLSQLRIHPDFKPGILKLSEIVLLEPDSSEAR